ncbi:unnamed protein product [Adineta steineri]|uniref:Uncharacterized protein n=1 Tax=Adineta steineri TaxID=433720 RepID=A0A815RAQ0_9BILA|nr:unnamed protein product [Adineta steineri]CAF4113904.1 unnamed protein product [Adineta steineri]
MSYCFRPADNNHSMLISDFQNTIHPSFTFLELKEKNITSQMLLSWSSSIDMAEKYQIFLNNYFNSPFETEILFHNCTSPWFGPFCRFTFEYDTDNSFEDVVDSMDSYRSEGTCYMHIPCKTILSCLDWREICDGKSDCLDGSDEYNCWQLEVNGCNNDEYRCHNGQCIPFEFFHDFPYQPDCLDRTDEEFNDFHERCSRFVTFECEEHRCRPGNEEFPCGDGQCINEISKCHNGRSSFLSSDLCSNATACSMQRYDLVNIQWCIIFCSDILCVARHCPTVYEFRYLPLLFGHVRFMLSEDFNFGKFTTHAYVCYDEKRCTGFLSPITNIGTLTCHSFKDLGLPSTDSFYKSEKLIEYVKNRFRGCSIITNETHYCNYSGLYQCKNSSKCISKQRLLDGIQDCLFNDDETFNQSCSLPDIRQRSRCSVDGNEKCFSLLINYDKEKNCDLGAYDADSKQKSTERHIYFHKICDGENDLLPLLIDGQNETDETECHQWPCNNIYSRCDTFWLCKNGADEANCSGSICSKDHHSCVFSNDTSKLSCLPIAGAGDDVDDCLGGTDERTKYYVVRKTLWNLVSYKFHCSNSTKLINIYQLCDSIRDCPLNDDESFCRNATSAQYKMCNIPIESMTDVEKFFCILSIAIIRPPQVNFKLKNLLTYPLQFVTDDTSAAPTTRTKTRSITKERTIRLSSNYERLCNRGRLIRVQMNVNISTLSCLCPPSYYGDRCQYQNQRVSLTLQIRLSSDLRSVFIFFISLFDNEKNIQSYDYIEYLPMRYCRSKFNIYLLYSTRPKNLSEIYSVQIDAFNQLGLKYRGSWIFPLRFSFLPVHRLSVLLRVPFSAMEPVHRCSPPCIHGQCLYYVNKHNSTFCHCESGWSGIQCNVKNTCDCAPNSLCISSSICLCPYGQFGLRCYLSQLSCRPDSCMNGGQCMPLDIRYTNEYEVTSICICPEGYIGDRCENQQQQIRIDISFHHKLTIPPLLIFHFIEVADKHAPTRSIAKKIQFDQYSLTLNTSISFNIAFVEMFDLYYLIILQEKTIVSGHISTQVVPSHRCQSIDELFNKTFANQHLLKRIKYYHIPCEQQPGLVCFHDSIHFCLCTLDHQANCFEFDHNKTYNCEGFNYCEHQGLCFQDDPECPTSSFCGCDQCFFGSKCQFSSKGSTPSLDTILAYHIHKNIGITQQPVIVKTVIALTVIMFIIGFINGFLSFQTFRREETQNVGCGLYLFTSSIISMITITVFTLKVWFLLVSQMGLINNRSFLNVQCASIDFFIRALLSTSDWLSACVAIERAVSVVKGVNFDKAQSKQMAKWLIYIIPLFTSCTYIYDPLNRRLVDDVEEQRTWCLTKFSSSLQTFDWFLNIFHFSLPFVINCISALTIIIIVAYTRSNSQKTKLFKEHLREQIHHFKHLLISPLILTVIAAPHLVISFLSGCMKSARHSKFYLIGYFISFIPSMMTFMVFILPSNHYKKVFIESIKRIWQ